MDETKLHQFIGQMLGDLGGALSVPQVRIGDRQGLYKALHANGPLTPGELAISTVNIFKENAIKVVQMTK